MIFATILAIAASELYIQGEQANVYKCTDLGTFGETFPIQEKNLLEVIKAKLQKLFESGQLDDHQKIISKKAKEQLNRPPAVKNLQKTIKPRSFTHDPSITVPYDLKDHEGKAFQAKGTKVNPLDTHEFKYPFLFVDGDDSSQVSWAIQQFQAAEASLKPKIILVQGAPINLSKKLDLPIYFDQSGVLVKKLGISQVPVRVSQKEKALIIEEITAKSEEIP
jgi:conjugal transfer pilus assembly protein TraW